MPHLTTYLGLADHGERVLADSLRAVGEGHAADADVFHTCHLLAGWSDRHRERLAPVLERFGEADVEEPERLHHDGLGRSRPGEIGLLRDLQDLHVLADLVMTTWTVVAQGAQGLRDRELLDVADTCRADTERQVRWLLTRIKQAAPQALLVAP